MRGKQTIVINGKVYDAVTGLPSAAPDVVSKPTPAVVKTPSAQSIQPTVTKPIVTRSAHHAANSHVAARKSATLHRDFLKKPTSQSTVGSARRKPAAGHTQKSPLIRKFAAHPQPLQKPAIKPAQVGGRMNSDISPTKQNVKPHAIVARTHALVAKPLAASVPVGPSLNTRSVKEQLIAEKMATAHVDSHVDTSKKQRKSMFGRQKLTSLMSASLAVIVLGGYFTYLNMPGLSVRVAAAQADVAASFPDYHPDGYRFNGPVAFAPGQVAIDFVANGGNTKYTVSEQKSSWDSQAVYDNVVAKTAEDSYVTNSQQGLTIYTFKGDAAWVNKGILYTISGDAPLSNEQLLRIAGSL